ncbi:hypothetical protein [Crossiella sp. CA198]|uniref:hypothetical protein n=1 Tax=Crossiella sp. CA198 TaxID=3455607 RepID=UPI003F8CF8AF
MSRVEQKAVRARLVPAALGLGIALAVTGCGAGMNSQTSVQVAAVNGASGKVGAIELRDGQLAFPSNNPKKFYPAKSNASLGISLINSGASDDKLVSVSSEGAGSVELKGDGAVPAGFAVRAELNEPEHATTSAATTSAAPTSTSGAAGSTSGRPTGSSATSTSAATPASSAVDSKLKVGTVVITVVGLKHDLWPGKTIPVVFTFAKAGQVTLQVPIAADEEHREDLPKTGGHGGGGGH